MASYGYEPDVEERSVSPLGASRFEQDWIPGIYEHTSLSDLSSRSVATTENTSPTSSRSSTDRYQHHATKPSLASTNGTAATSINLDGAEMYRPSSSKASTPMEAEDAHEWLARFRSDTDIAAGNMNECPDRATLAAVYDIPVYDAEGNPRPFGSLYDPNYTPHERQLIVFVRHFYCGACQAYLKALTDGITMRDYFGIFRPTSIIVIGCGQPEMIQHYKTFTNNSPWPMFTDPSRQLFKKLGMKLSLKIGTHRPEYMKDISPLAWIRGQHETIKRSLKDPDGIKRKDVLKGGHPMQIGGEFLFDEGQVVWAHRMSNYRDHAEIKVVRKLLEIDE